MKHFIKAQAKLLVTVLTLVVVLGIGATVAYLHDTTGVVRNIFDPAQLDTKIEETLGTNGTKQVVIANTGKSDAYVRARVMVSGVKNGQLQIVDSLNEVAEDSSVVYLVMPNVGTGEKKWSEKDSKEFYYYNTILHGTNSVPGNDKEDLAARRTSQLLQAVIIGDQVLKDDPDFLDTFSVTITHESVLASGYDSARAAFEAAEERK
ncbi:hypothetical protein [Allofournierella massiliensis]|mgnify:CR=1 FL=1|uniref:hypothetical protein n=1 Tax=Allofournierella massiliensis TaxID=1650663 RepID=UPI0024B1A9B1|nr:hypothetical protein [Fournierella massiliensis]